jgi:hypothetical protein
MMRAESRAAGRGFPVRAVRRQFGKKLPDGACMKDTAGTVKASSPSPLNLQADWGRAGDR